MFKNLENKLKTTSIFQTVPIKPQDIAELTPFSKNLAPFVRSRYVFWKTFLDFPCFWPFFGWACICKAFAREPSWAERSNASRAFFRDRNRGDFGWKKCDGDDEGKYITVKNCINIPAPSSQGAN